MQDGRYPLGDLKASWLYGIDCPQRPLVSTCFNYIIYNYIFTHARTHTHMEYIYICNYYTVYNICMIKHTHIHAIRIYSYTHTHTDIYVYIYIYYIHNYCMSYVYLWYAENYLRYTLSSDSFSPGDFYQNGV